MSRRDDLREDLESRVSALEEQFGFSPTRLVLVGPGPDDWPEGVGPEDIEHRVSVDDPDDPIDAYSEAIVPHFRPRQYRGGIVLMSEAEIARVYASMPEDISEQELEYRIENGPPIPPILQA